MAIQVAYLTNDLMFSSRVTSLARQAGVAVNVVGSRRALCEQVLASKCAAIFVDLEHPDAGIAELLAELPSGECRPKIVAYGPHVKESMLAAAQVAGAEAVLSRGQFDKQAGSILQSLASQHNAESPKESS